MEGMGWSCTETEAEWAAGISKKAASPRALKTDEHDQPMPQSAVHIQSAQQAAQPIHSEKASLAPSRVSRTRAQMPMGISIQQQEPKQGIAATSEPVKARR